ncbi:MAG: hypothetical protein COZ75_02295 [Flavobacteriaceae bacterium CG_4_8_14_3_um_filter_34_10]|nr:peroxide stress protein YaaA [Flavobacteriia bacterium]OIP49990.1 MAG: hypothetical protein AUK33_08810 [Flavobacteriaceae bacterium CG2_30_34_30]PIX10300.1 MAG: hypothetical protein COZ75_02295 [Flavobacteriaceae bacterium CG_4_8_14_3_um_filter_34_10]PJC07884.1 MAG: hypothetical protein CO068_04000 [Flavobacteriaceae bacterium CG_4_9_14_0_8_um_filter_34_30]
MKILLSPAKTLDFKSKLPTLTYTQALFLEEAATINAVLKKKSKQQLKNLMSISDALAALNFQRNQEFSLPFTNDNARQAIYAFSGDVYVGLDAYSIPIEKLDKLQNKVRIISGLYGLLKPLDLIQAYRLEMGTDLKVKQKKNLYEFWSNKITQSLNDELNQDEIIINLASKEYFKSVNTKKLKGNLINPVFKDFKNGKLKIISFFAKKARGSMTRYILDNEVNTYNDLLKFNMDGYAFNAVETKNENKPVFIR